MVKIRWGTDYISLCFRGRKKKEMERVLALKRRIREWVVPDLGVETNGDKYDIL